MPRPVQRRGIQMFVTENKLIGIQMKIEKNKFVTLSYELRTGSAEGEIVEKTDSAAPLRFLFGSGRMLEKFESGLEGLESGADFTIFSTRRPSSICPKTSSWSTGRSAPTCWWLATTSP